MARLARNLDDLRRIVLGLTERGIHVVFVKEYLTFTGEDSPMSNLLLSAMGAFAEFERELIGERQRKGIAIARTEGTPAESHRCHQLARPIQLSLRAGSLLWLTCWLGRSALYHSRSPPAAVGA